MVCLECKVNSRLWDGRRSDKKSANVAQRFDERSWLEVSNLTTQQPRWFATHYQVRANNRAPLTHLSNQISTKHIYDGCILILKIATLTLPTPAITAGSKRRRLPWYCERLKSRRTGRWYWEREFACSRTAGMAKWQQAQMDSCRHKFTYIRLQICGLRV